MKRYLLKVLVACVLDSIMALIATVLVLELVRHVSPDMPFLNVWAACFGLRQLVSVAVHSSDE